MSCAHIIGPRSQTPASRVALASARDLKSHLEILRGFLDDWGLVRNWGRIGGSRQLRTDWFDTEAAAKDVRFALHLAKAMKGYEQVLGRCPVSEGSDWPRLIMPSGHPGTYTSLEDATRGTEWVEKGWTFSTCGNNALQLSSKDRDLICQQFMFGGVTGGKLAIESLFPEDLSRRELCLDILRPVADHLGELWRQDKAVFMSVRVALLRMEALLRATADPLDPVMRKTRRQAIFACVPNEGHTLGVQMAADLQRTKGWDVQVVIHAKWANLLSQIVNSPAQILGLSIGSSSAMHGLYVIVQHVKRNRPDMRILVSGALVGIDPQPIEYLGVAGHAVDFQEAEKMLDAMVGTTIKPDDRLNDVTVLPLNLS